MSDGVHGIRQGYGFGRKIERRRAMMLLDEKGRIVASAPFEADGSFTFSAEQTAKVEAGTYTMKPGHEQRVMPLLPWRRGKNGWRW